MPLAMVLGAMGLSAALVLPRLGERLFWDDEANTAIYARNLLRFGRITAWDGTNLCGYGLGGALGEDLGQELRVPTLPAYVAAASMAPAGPDDLRRAVAVRPGGHGLRGLAGRLDAASLRPPLSLVSAVAAHGRQSGLSLVLAELPLLLPGADVLAGGPGLLGAGTPDAGAGRPIDGFRAAICGDGSALRRPLRCSWARTISTRPPCWPRCR